MRKIYVLIIFLLLVALPSFAQETGLAEDFYTKEDTLLALEDTYANKFNPRKASLYSAILPGLGQAYNKNYWKIPIIYGGFTALAFTIDFYHDNYVKYRRDLFAEIDDNELTVNQSGFDTDQLRRIVNRTRRERDFFMILTGVLYFLQIAEAHVDAHLKEFKLNPELRVQLEPNMQYARGLNSGFTVKLKF